jgi:hypothetical protein
VVLLVLLGLSGRRAHSQEFSESISRVGEEYARGYVAPLVDALGTNFNAGLVPAATLGSGTNGITVYFGVKAFGAFVPEDRKRFSISYVNDVPISRELGTETIELNVPATFTIEQAPSFFGESDAGEMTVRIQQDTTFSYLGLTLPISFDTTFTLQGIGGIWNTGVAPFLVPEVVLGTFLGTSVMLRWVPGFSVENSERMGFLGFGVQHSLNPYMPGLPVDVGVQAVWQRAGAEDDQGNQVVRMTTFAANVHVGKRFGLLGVYGALQSEQSRARLRYEYIPSAQDSDLAPVPTRFTVAGANKMRVVLGLDLELGLFHANTDISIGRMNSMSLGLGLAY